MEKVITCERCSTAIAVDLGMGADYYGPTVRCARCNSILLMSSFIFTPHIVPTRPIKTLYWTGSVTMFPPLTIEPLIIEDMINWTFPPLPSGVK